MSRECQLSIHEARINSALYRFIYQDLANRIEPIEKDFSKMLIIDDFNIIHKYLSFNNEIITLPFTKLDKIYNTQSFDLIIFPLGLHKIDALEFLKKIRESLKDDGILICNFFGSGTLIQLKKLLINLELMYKTKHTQHLIPFIKYQHVATLFNYSKFSETIIDSQILEIEQESALKLMNNIKKFGEINNQYPKSYSISKNIYKDLSKDHFTDKVNLITTVACKIKSTLKLKNKYFDL